MLPDVHTILNIATALGIAVLAVPVLALNKRKKSLAQISDIVAERKTGEEKSALNRIAANLEENAATRANRWRRADEICLYLGYVLLLGASVLRVFFPIGT